MTAQDTRGLDREAVERLVNRLLSSFLRQRR